MTLAYDPMLGPFLPSGPTSPPHHGSWFAPLDVLSPGPGIQEANFSFGSPPGYFNKNCNVLLGFHNDQQIHDQQQSDGNCEDVISQFFGNQLISSCGSQLDDFSYENGFSNGLQSDWQDQFVSLREDGSDASSWSSSSPRRAVGGQGHWPPGRPPTPVPETSPRHSSACSEPEDLAALVEVVDWPPAASEQGSPLYKDEQQVLDEIYRECEHAITPRLPGLPAAQQTTVSGDVQFEDEENEVEDEEEDEWEAGPAWGDPDKVLELRKKGQNRRAASRYRSRRRSERRALKVERQQLESVNKRLLNQVSDLQREVDYLNRFLSEIRQKAAKSA